MVAFIVAFHDNKLNLENDREDCNKKLCDFFSNSFSYYKDIDIKTVGIGICC